jgi:phospholipid/cholesterol/gamma-HCH transport system substrate-binding protein
MTASRYRYVKVALFFILLGGIGGAYIILSSDGFNAFNTKLYEVVLQDATGLSTRSKIYLAGVTVGKIQDIHLEGSSAHLKVAFFRNVEIRENASIARQSSSILGTSILALNPGTELSPILPEGGTINAAQNTRDMNAVLDMVQNLGGQITGLVAELQNNQLQVLTTTLESFNAIVGKINDRSDAELDRVSRILESAALITERTQRILENREEDLEGAVMDIHAALANIRMITDDIRLGRGNLGRVFYDEQFYGNILSITEKTNAAMDKLQDVMDTAHSVAANVDGVVSTAGEIRDRANGLGIMLDTNARYDTLAKTMRAGASLRLEPASGDRWYRVGVSSVPGGIVSRTVKETTTVGGDSPGVVHSDTTETRYTVALDVELARRFGPVTLRGGLLENTGGIGLDIQPLRWISLSAEVFDFRTGEAPNLRSTVTVFPFFDPSSDKLWNWLYLRGGVDNVLRDERDFFVGAGLRFTDREIRGLVGLVPLVK